MKKRLVKEYLLFTFSIMLPFWGICVFMSQKYHFTVDTVWMRIFYMIGGFSPTLASYAALKRNGEVGTAREWLKQIFTVRYGVRVYAEAVLFVLTYFVINCLANGYTAGAPVFMTVIIVPMMLFGGGNEEAGWRMILQPELEKAFGFHAATLFTAGVWWVWHLPLFFIHGTANEYMNFFLFGIQCLTLSYAMATVRKHSDGIFPCILVHCLVNGVSATLVFESSLFGSALCLGVTMLLSALFLSGPDKLDIRTNQPGKKRKAEGQTTPDIRTQTEYKAPDVIDGTSKK